LNTLVIFGFKLPDIREQVLTITVLSIGSFKLRSQILFQ
jgi:hypothetical protein